MPKMSRRMRHNKQRKEHGAFVQKDVIKFGVTSKLNKERIWAQKYP